MKKLKRNKAFTLVELIIVIAILAIIMLIGSVAYSGVQERTKVRADKATAGQIGKALVIREVDVPKEKGIALYPNITRYDQIENIENYVSKDIKPQSMKDGYFFATSFITENGKKIVVGIGKAGEEIKDNIYTDSKKGGWAWSEDVEISEFIEENIEEIEKEEVILPEPSGGSSSGGTGGNNSGNQTPQTGTYSLIIGINNILTTTVEKEAGKQINVNLGGTYSETQITGISETGTNLNFTMPEQTVKIIGITE